MVAVAGIADAVDRETAWLTTSGDALPALLTSAGGVFDLVQAYLPRTPATRQTQLYVMRNVVREKRFALIRRMPTYSFDLRITWPVGAGDAQQAQRDLDAALADVFARVGGFMGDHTHGGAFRSAAEDPGEVTAHIEDPAQTLPGAVLRATVAYWADEFEFTG